MAKVALLNLNLDAVQRVAGEICAAGGTAVAYKADVLKRKAMDMVPTQVKTNIAPCDILVNGAGGNNPVPKQTKTTTRREISTLKR